MKALLFGMLLIISYICLVISVVWGVVSFIIYITKDIPLDWGSVWCIGGSLVLMITMFVLNAIFSVRETGLIGRKRRF